VTEDQESEQPVALAYSETGKGLALLEGVEGTEKPDRELR
jgi:hypothetical protein